MAGPSPCLHTFRVPALAGLVGRQLVLAAILALAVIRPSASATDDGEVNPPMPAAYRLGTARRLQTVVNTPADYIVLANVDNVPDTWVVHEFEMFFGHCYENKRIILEANLIVSSGTRPENAFDIATKAVDDDLETVWYSQCKRPIGGCQENQAWIGMDLTITAEYRNARVENVSEELLEAARVRCVRFYQSVDPLRRTSRIAIREGRWNGQGTDWITFQELDDCAGGIWSRKPAIENTLWRISNLASTVAGWAVSELKFYEDILCTWPLTGTGSFSSPTKVPLETHSVFYAFDDDVSTTWIAGCELGGCFQREAHLGIDMSDTPKIVRCIRMYQYQHDWQSRTPEDPAFTSGIELDRWDGLKWVHVERFWDLSFAFPVDMAPTYDTPFLGIGPGVWEDTRTQNFSAWRLVNDDHVHLPWQVHELEFYTSVDCTGDVVTGEPLSMQGPAGVTEVGYAFDGNSAQDLHFWTSGCAGYNGSCAPKEAWLGIYVRGSSPDVKCFRLLQSRSMINQARSIVLSAWQGGEWVQVSLHRDVGGGGWNRRPAPPRTMWRVTNLAPVVEQWKIAEVRAYSDPICLFELPRDLPLAGGYLHFSDTFEKAWDDQFGTYWGADCNPCNSTRHQWLGMQMPHNSGNISTGLDFLRCIKIWQSNRFEEQSQGIRIHVWDGSNWAISPSVIDQPYIGGGQWSRHPASHMTKWRLRPLSTEAMYWRMTELEFYSSVDCLPETRLPMPITGQGGASVTLSGFDQELRNYQLIEAVQQWTGDGVWSEGLRGMDADDLTSTRLVHMPSEGLPAWFGVDFLSETTWVRCVRVQQGNLKPEQSPSLVLEFWQGRNWTGLDMELGPTEFHLEGLGGSGYHRRPAQENSLWRLENGEHVAEGWAVYEVQFHNVETCVAEEIGVSSRLEGSAFASGFAPADIFDNRPSSAFDQSLDTAWVAQCAFIPEELRPADLTLPDPGCEPGEAWIGLDIGRSEQVRCVRILQVGYRSMQSSIIDLSRWDGRAWQHAWQLHGIGGNSWNQRPAMSNSMWRVLETRPKVERCEGQMRRTFMRSWGVAELGFYSDDSCSSEITGGLAISSGSVETYIRSTLDSDSGYNVENAFDGDENTVWAANCLLGWRESRSERVNCQDEWLGLDFAGVAVEVRCVRFMQARLESPTCCDMADELALQRWNGTRWVEAKWRHEPGAGSAEAYRWLGATFTGVGECPASTYTGSYRDAKIWTTRSRRDSDSCLVPLSTGISLLAEPSCVEHSRCIFAHGPAGVCCPMQGLESRCCCNFLTGEQYSEPIFVDEEDTNKVRASLAVEFAVVLVSDYLPFIGAGLAVWLYLTAIILPADALERVARWLADRPGCCRKTLAVLAWPTLTWRSFLAESDSLAALGCVWCCLPNRRRPRPVETPRFVIFLFAGILFVGVMPFLGMGLLLGKIFLNISLMLCIVVRWTKSPYDPQKPMDMRMRAAATLEPLQKADDSAHASHVAFDFVTFIVLGFVYYLKFIFDLLLIRAQMISYSAIGPIEAERVVNIFPGMMRPLREPAMLIYWVMYHAGQMVSYTIGFLIGLPRCEGATALISCVALVLVLVTVTQWLNYDFFGLFAAGRQAVKTTRPACQRVMAQGAIMASLSVVFGIIQCAMVLFSRALNMANPFKEQVWMCEWNDTFALYMGRGLLILTAISGLIFVTLCVNGHFMGQDYILRPVGEMLRLNLDGLDPDGTGPKGGIVRCNTGFSALPSVLGIWFDWWNIRAFLVKERAHVYASELNDPQPCRKCGCIHVSYSNMMCATGRQIGLACQILPYGILIGKASEYFNDPPLAYFGTQLPCYGWRVGPVEPRPKLGKRKYGLKALLLCADVCTLVIEYGIPLVRRLCAVCLFLAMLAGTFLVTETNLAKMGGNVVLAGFYLSFIKAGGEAFFESTLSFCVGILYKAIYEAEGSLEDAAPIPRTVAGQTLVGTVVGSVLAVVVPVAGWANSFEGGAFACVFGYFLSLVTLGVNFMLEEKVVPGRARRASSFRLSAKLLYALAVGCLVGLFASPATVLRGVIGLTMAVTAVTAISLQLLLLGSRVVADPFDPQSVDNGMWDSPAFRVLATLHFLPGLVGIPCGTVSSIFVGTWIFGDYTQVVARASLAMPFAMFSGVIVALTVNRLLQSYPQLIGSFAGLGAFVLLGLWKPTYATAISVFFGATVGSVFELCLIVERIEAEEQKITLEAVGRAKEAELRARKGLAPLEDDFTTPEEAEQLKTWEQKASALNRDARFTAAKARCLADAPIANGLACEIYGDTLILGDNAIQDGVVGDTKIAVAGSVVQGFTKLRVLADPEQGSFHETTKTGGTEEFMLQDQPIMHRGTLQLKEPTSPSNYSVKEYEDPEPMDMQATTQIVDSEPAGFSRPSQPALSPEAEIEALLAEPLPETPYPQNPIPLQPEVPAERPPSAPSTTRNGFQPAPMPTDIANDTSPHVSPQQSQAGSTARRRRGAGRALALVDNLNLERSDDANEEPPPQQGVLALAKPEEAQRQTPTTFVPQEEDDDKLFGRWDRAGNAPGRRGGSEPRRVQRPLPKPSLWAHRVAPPPAPVPSFREDKRLGGRKPPVT